ncbi:toll/interleukin-1 receptor domain-containing protein [Sphingomicrobium lutaoense]|uniref:Tetratricopeptide (TPR) repeat protein n=1 Tax=Sphingomicrobium lutaoense TaxID=515949 RepID=A0A839Z137_9SPHN|nr:toll/interleukin-1 receptor domain-containing protein [Sphingomicrobium lutaoense]MBB3764390.1 tetratricopeptide (TPR) repeat protein [Sphingomicrobium lutaoense]
MGERRYKAFLSYSHRDKAVANWLHRALETYRLPEDLVAEGAPERLHPIFKDREELAAADDLGAAIREAIHESQAMIVLCSPDAAASPWIAKEVDAFKREHGDRDVYPVVVAGEPPDNFPPPLRTHYEHGAPGEGLAEPVAADLRPEGDGRKLARLKLVAGLAGVPLDRLVQRDQARKQKRLAMVAAASLLGMVGTSGLALYAIDQRDEAREQRAEADGLIEFMLTDLRKQLEPVGRLELLDSVGARALDYYARQKLKEMSHSELGRRARAVQLVAEVQNLRGNNEAALPAFREAARTTAELLERRPDDPEAMFNHGQSLFWVGYIAWQHERLDEARRALRGYADISERLAAKDRTNLDWQMEAAYSQTNLGALAVEEGRHEEALAYFEQGVRDTERVAQAEGRPPARMISVAEAESWVSTTLASLGRWRDSARSRMRQIEVYRSILEQDANNHDALQGLVFALGQMGMIHMMTGEHRAAQSDLDEAIAGARTLRAADADNTLSVELALDAWINRGLLHFAQGRDQLAREDFRTARELAADLARRDRDNPVWNKDNLARVDLHEALTVEKAMAPRAMAELAGRWISRLADEPVKYEWELVAAHLLHGEAMRREGRAGDARTAWRKALAVAGKEADPNGYRSLALKAAAAERLGERSRAREYRGRLQRMGIDPPIDEGLTSS